MPTQNVNSPSSAPLPLFRPEPIAARLRMEGEVLLVRPLSLSLLTGLALGVAAALIAGLLLIRVPESRSLPVATTSTGAENGTITFAVPQDMAAKIAVADRLPLTFTSAAGAPQKTFATVEHATALPDGETEIAARISPPDVPLPARFYIEMAGTRSLASWLLHKEGQ